MNANKPTVLCFSGLDPTGGAGLQADIETLFSIGCHCTPIATALTVQNTQNAISLQATEAALLEQQARTILKDMTVQCFKIGLLGISDRHYWKQIVVISKLLEANVISGQAAAAKCLRKLTNYC